jgi:hypothetical protein
MSVSDLSGSLPEGVRSLAATAVGEAVEIRSILFEAVRSLCYDLGVREGDIVRCRADGPSHLLLETPRGRTVSLDRDWARFIQVEDPLTDELDGRLEFSRAVG